MNRDSKALAAVRELNVIDDALFQKMAEDIGFCEELISTILGENVTVKSVVPQNTIKNLQGRSVQLDALCVMEDGKYTNVEVQKANKDDHARRVRYNTSCITANITETGKQFREVPDVIAVYISQFDMFHAGKTVYHIDRVIRETGEIQDNGIREIYVNTKIDDGTDIAQLMRIFRESEAYDFEKFPRISQRKYHFKNNEGGHGEMCEVVENYAKEYAKEYAKDEAVIMARKLFENGADYALVQASISSLTEAELKEIYEKVQAK